MNLENRLDQTTQKNEIINRKDDQKELKAFSKKYASFFRKEIAQKINNLRFAYQNKLIEKPEEIKKYQEEIEQKNERIELIDVENGKNKESILINEEEIEEVEKELELAKQVLNDKKNSFLFKLKKVLSKRNAEFDISILESNIEYKTKTLDYHKNEKNISDKSLMEKEEIISKIKNEIEEKYKLISETDSILKSDEEFKEIHNLLNDFYDKIREEKINFESELEKRDIRKISQEKDVLFCHSLPINIYNREAESFAQNNRLMKIESMGDEEKIKMIIGAEPTISVCTINDQSQKLPRPFGLILKDGYVLSAYAGDAGTLVGENIYDRKSKYDKNLKYSNIQEDIEENINSALTHTRGENDSTSSLHQGWNELVIENPKVAGLFFQENEDYNKYKKLEDNVEYVKKMAEDLMLPVYLIRDKKIFKVSFSEELKDTFELNEISKKEILNNETDFSKEKKSKFLSELIDKEFFYKKEQNIYQFNSYNYGKIYFNFIKKIDAGEIVDIAPINKKDFDKNQEKDFYPMDQGGIRIRDLKKEVYTEDEWELYGKKRWDGGYFDKEKGELKSKFYGWFSGWELWGKFDSNKPIGSYIDLAEDHVSKDIDRIKKAKIEKNNEAISNLNLRKKSYIFNLYGFANECKKVGDLENFEKAKKVIEKFGDLRECEEFIAKRLGEDRKFKILNEDIPIGIREKLKELKE